MSQDDRSDPGQYVEAVEEFFHLRGMEKIPTQPIRRSTSERVELMAVHVLGSALGAIAAISIEFMAFGGMPFALAGGIPQCAAINFLAILTGSYAIPKGVRSIRNIMKSKRQ